MTPGTTARWVARRLPVADDAHRDELAESVAAVAAERPRCDRAWEAASLVGLWLRLWGRREGGDNARLALRQGVYLGGTGLLFVVSALAWSGVFHGATGRAVTGAASLGQASAGLVAGAALASGAAMLASGGWRIGAVGAAVASLVASAVTGGGVPSALGAVAALALAVGDRFGGRHCWRGLATGALIAAALAGLASQVSVAEVVPRGGTIAVVAVPLVLLAVGWFEPRFAVAATTAWLGASFAVATQAWPEPVSGGVPSLGALHWWMPAVVLVAAGVSRAALRRAFAV
jgi:hypothetical protein